jgi:hypothetical protein
MTKATVKALLCAYVMLALAEYLIAVSAILIILGAPLWAPLFIPRTRVSSHGIKPSGSLLDAFNRLSRCLYTVHLHVSKTWTLFFRTKTCHFSGGFQIFQSFYNQGLFNALNVQHNEHKST